MTGEEIVRRIQDEMPVYPRLRGLTRFAGPMFPIRLDRKGVCLSVEKTGEPIRDSDKNEVYWNLNELS